MCSKSTASYLQKSAHYVKNESFKVGITMYEFCQQIGIFFFEHSFYKRMFVRSFYVTKEPQWTNWFRGIGDGCVAENDGQQDEE